MEREVIILAKSKKYGGYCVAGIDAQTGEWIRLVSADKGSHGAVPKYSMVDKKGEVISILDQIKVEVVQHIPEGHQVENYLYDSSKGFIKQGTVSLNSIVNRVKKQSYPYIFYNAQRSISEQDAHQIPNEKWHSLQWIQVKELRIYTKQNNYRNNISYRGEIQYNGHCYKDLSITDEDFIKRCKKEQIDTLYNPFLVTSLSVAFEKDNKHYKLIATVIENKLEAVKKRRLFGFNFNEAPF